MYIDLEKYKESLILRELSETTIQSYVRIAEKFEEFRGQRDISKELVIEYKKKIIAEKLAVSTINLHIIGVNKYIRACGKDDCTVKCIKLQKRRSLENVISQEEYCQLLHYALENGYKKYYYIMKTLALTGIRVSELKYVTVGILDRGYALVKNKGKIREIYLPESLVQGLSKYCEEENIDVGIIFRGRTQAPISREAVWKRLKQLAETVGIDKSKVYPHSFRHYFALNYMEHFSNLFELADILGHSNLETTRIYASSSIKSKREKMEQLDIY